MVVVVVVLMLVVWMGGNNIYVCEEHPPPTRPTGWFGKSDITSKLYEPNRVLDTVRGEWVLWIGASVATRMVEIGSGLVGFIVFEEPFSLQRRIHTPTNSLRNKIKEA